MLEFEEEEPPCPLPGPCPCPCPCPRSCLPAGDGNKGAALLGDEAEHGGAVQEKLRHWTRAGETAEEGTRGRYPTTTLTKGDPATHERERGREGERGRRSVNHQICQSTEKDEREESNGGGVKGNGKGKGNGEVSY